MFSGEKGLKYPGLSVQLKALDKRNGAASDFIEVTEASGQERAIFVKRERTGRQNIKKAQGDEVIRRRLAPLERPWTSTGKQGGTKHFPPETVQGSE